MTDAQVVLGYIASDDLAGGEITLNHDAAEEAISRLASSAGLDFREAAEGVLRIVRVTMARAIRSVSVERGKDARRYALVAFGGAGPLHATALARELGISTVIVPPAPGALAALGLLVASRRADASVTRPMIADRARDVELRSILHELTESVLADLRLEGVSFADALIEHVVDCRYDGQSHELRIPVEGGPSFALVAQAFHAAHKKRYGFDRPRVPVEIVTFRAAALGPAGEVTVKRTGRGEVRASSVRRVGDVDVPVFERSAMPVDAGIDGPAIITELDSTTWVDDRSTALVHDSGALVVRVS